MFHAWVKELIDSPLTAEPTYADVQQLNAWALEKRFPLTKLSMAALRHITDDYTLLPIGAALGFNCGPKIIGHSQKIGTIAIPGKLTTAHLLFDHLIGSATKKVFCSYDEIYGLLHTHQVDSGLIIHESRFTFEQEGFEEIVDLGTLWQEKYQLPLPLGGLALRRDQELPELLPTLSASIDYAFKHPRASEAYVLEHSQEKDPRVIAKHIQTYVTQESRALSNDGVKALEILLQKPKEAFLYAPDLVCTDL